MIESLDRATRILDLFSSDIPEWTVSEVSRTLGLPKTTAWEHLKSMVELGLLRKSGAANYRLGWRSFQLGLRARATSEIARPARAELQLLAERFGETAQLVSRYGTEVVYLEKVVVQSGVRSSLTRVGERLPSTCTAGGKALLAHLASPQLDELFPGPGLPQMTEKSLDTVEKLARDLELVRRRGYAVDHEETLEGMCCVAAVIRNRQGDATWALTLSFLEYKFDQHAAEYAQALIEASERLSHPLLPELEERSVRKTGN